MLQPWVSFIALLVSLVLLWQLGSGSLAWLGGLLLAAALLGPWALRLGQRWGAWRRRKKSLKKAEKLDWAFIENTLSRERIQRDCERPETLGVCTGRDCLVYEQCDFNIKKPMP